MKELLDSIIEFLEENLGENYIWITAGIAALLIIIIAVAAAGRKKKTAEPGDEVHRDFFLEGEYDTMIRDAALATKAANAAAEPAEVVQEEPEAAETEPEADEAAEVTEVAEVTAEEQDALKEELQQVHININIERGQVRIGCEDDGRITCIVETDEESAGAHEDPELTAALAAGEIEAAESPEGKAEGKAVLDNQGIILEKINLVKAAPAKKFGPDNFNTGRSGRVFTEEELREQIKQ